MMMMASKNNDSLGVIYLSILEGSGVRTIIIKEERLFDLSRFLH